METRLPPDLCLLGCIFVLVDCQDMEEAKHLPEWKKVITQYGGEIEESQSYACPGKQPEVIHCTTGQGGGEEEVVVPRV